MTKSIPSARAIVVIALAAFWSGCATVIAADFQGNIPANRLDGNTYTSPDGGFTLTLPPLMNPRLEERQLSPTMQGIFVADDLGRVYVVLRTDNSSKKETLERIANSYPPSNRLRAKEIVTTPRGQEIRLLAVIEGASPLIARTEKDGKTTERRGDLVKAISIFLHEDYIYDVTAGVTPLGSKPEAEVAEDAKKRLDEFLSGLKISVKKSAP